MSKNNVAKLSLVDGPTHQMVELTDNDLLNIQEFLQVEIENNGVCSTTEKLIEIMSITDYPVTREFEVTVKMTVKAFNDHAATRIVDSVLNNVDDENITDSYIDGVTDLT